jgi:hypothetical protein
MVHFMESKPALSLIVPTRQRTLQLRRLLESLVATAANPKDLEIVLVVDADDPDSLEFSFEGLPLKRVMVEPGLTMGTLNMAGYEVSSGDRLMLLNDDVVARTKGWDKTILACFEGCSDDILLVHVNDLLFKDSLCVFPIVSRTYCRLTGGICPRTYIRYRIDDHIEDVFNLLGLLGERRSIYLPEVIFEHFKFVTQPEGEKQYYLDESILAVDAPHFAALLPQRKELALKLKHHIVDQARGKNERLWRSRLDTVQDSLALRVPSRLRVEGESPRPGGTKTRVTIGLATPDSRGKLFSSCLEAIRAYTQNYELIVLESPPSPDIHRARDLNRILGAVNTDHVVLMGDNFLVGPGWLDALLSSMTRNVAVVTWPGQGPPHRLLTVSCPLLLLDRATCRALFFDEGYRSYLCLADFGFKVWGAGCKVVAASLPSVSRRSPGPWRAGGALPEDLLERDEDLFTRRWLATGIAGRSDLRTLLDLERLGPPQGVPLLGKIGRLLSETISRAGNCVRLKGYRGLVQAVWRRLAGRKSCHNHPHNQAGELAPDQLKPMSSKYCKKADSECPFASGRGRL